MTTQSIPLQTEQTVAPNDQVLDGTGVVHSRLGELLAGIAESNYSAVKVTVESSRHLQSLLGLVLRRCYISDEDLEERASGLGLEKLEVLETKLPDPGSTMAGDFGEVLIFLFHLGEKNDSAVLAPKKWRLKQDRTKPAPHSDVIHFVMPEWPNPSKNDELICSEVKTKSTAGASRPISSAITDSAKDKTSRLARTLTWLREREISDGKTGVALDKIQRFIDAVGHPQYAKKFCACVVICESLFQAELDANPLPNNGDHRVIFVTVPNLKQVYEAAFTSIRATLV